MPLPNCRPVREFLAFFRNLESLMANPCTTSLMRRAVCVRASNSAACQSDFCQTYCAWTGSFHIVEAAAATAPPRRDRRENSFMEFSPLAVPAIVCNLNRIIRRPLRIVHKSAWSSSSFNEQAKRERPNAKYYDIVYRTAISLGWIYSSKPVG